MKESLIVNTKSFLSMLALLIFVSCNAYKSNSAGEDHIHKYINRNAKQLNLDKINVGFDSLQIRIWINQSFSDSNQVVIIKQEKGHWFANLYDIKTQYVSVSNIDTILSYQQRSLIPKTSWIALLTLLMNEKIQELPNQMDIENFEPRLTDGWMCIVEMADRKSYRFYSYSNPDFYTDRQSHSVMNILNIIENEFKIELYGKGLNKLK